MAAPVERYDGYLIDLDGVLWAGSKTFPEAVRTVNRLRSMGKAVVFLTNNSTRSRSQYVERLRSIGVDWVEEGHVVNSGYATSKYLAERFGRLHVFPVGDTGLHVELVLQGHALVSQADCWTGRVDAVVVGMDPSITYWKIGAAAAAIRRGAMFVATNPDKTFPTERGLMPGAGTILAALEASSGRSPEINIGKPHRPIFEVALEALGVERERVLVVGDRLDTDVVGASVLGLDSALVLTGVATEEDLREAREGPAYVLRTLEDLFSVASGEK